MFLPAAAFRSESGDRSTWGDWWFGPVPGRSGAVTESTAMQLSSVYTCVRILAETLGQVPFRLYRERDDGYLEPQRNHPLYTLVARRPNRWQTPFEFKEMMEGHVVLRGNAYALIVFDDRTGFAAELIPLHPDCMTVRVSDAGRPIYEYLQANGTRDTYSAGEIIHIRGLSSDGYVGLSPIAMQRQLLSGASEIEDYSRRFYQNDAQPRGVIEHPGKFANDDERKRFVEAWQGAQTGLNRGKAAVLQFGMKYHEMKISNEDAQFLETKVAKRAEIFGMFRVPLHMGGGSDPNHANIEKFGIEFINYTMQPWFTRWEETFALDLIDEERDGKLVFKFHFASMMRADTAAQAAYYRVAAGPGGWMVRNEVRLETGLPPRDDMDRPLEPVNAVKPGEQPVEDDEEEPPEPPEAPPKQAPAAHSDAVLSMARAAGERVILRANGLLKDRKESDIDAESFRGFAAKVLGITIARATILCRRISDDARTALSASDDVQEAIQILIGTIPDVAAFALSEE